MKNSILISLLVAAMGVMAFVGCEKPEPIEEPQIVVINPQDTTPVTHNTTLSYTGCHSNQSKGDYDPIISISYENNTLLLTIENLRVNCADDNVISADWEFDNQTIKVNLHESSYSANCICPIDVNYSIDNINTGIYELIITKNSLTIYQEEITCE
ncbi:MAG: hypothetical protein IK025_03625 [Bacteroidales bacterium]|nr:hypothetical protein [Bacteroidales bacterium]